MAKIINVSLIRTHKEYATPRIIGGTSKPNFMSFEFCTTVRLEYVTVQVREIGLKNPRHQNDDDTPSFIKAVKEAMPKKVSEVNTPAKKNKPMSEFERLMYEALLKKLGLAETEKEETPMVEKKPEPTADELKKKIEALKADAEQRELMKEYERLRAEAEAVAEEVRKKAEAEAEEERLKKEAEEEARKKAEADAAAKDAEIEELKKQLAEALAANK